MTKQEFVSALLDRGFVVSEYNTNNAWGFGGGIGDQYTKGDVKVKIGTSYFRHQSPAKYITVTIGTRRVLDRDPSAKAFDAALKAIEPQPDVLVRNEGSIFLLTPMSDTAREWIKEHIPDDAMYMGRSLVVEHRYVEDIVAGMQGDGLIVK